jgi:hypothetical protein
MLLSTQEEARARFKTAVSAALKMQAVCRRAPKRTYNNSKENFYNVNNTSSISCDFNNNK